MNIEETTENLKKYISFSKKECNFPSIWDWNWHMDLANDVKTLLTAYEKSKGLEEKIKKYINIIQKELDKYKIKNTNTYLQIEGNPEISELLIQKATLEELIKEE